MFQLPPNHDDFAHILGIDPGSETLGVSCISVNPYTLEIVYTQAVTFIGSKLNMNPQMLDTHSARFARIAAHQKNLKNLFTEIMPVSIVCESPFFNPRRPNAFAPLVETLDAIRRAVWEYDQVQTLELVDPPTVKMAVGCRGNADQDAMNLAVMALPDLNYCGAIPFYQLDEHSIDAIAVAYSKICQYRGK